MNPPPFKCTSNRSPFTFTSVTVTVSPRLTPAPYFFTRAASSSAAPGTSAPESSPGKSTNTRTCRPFHPGSVCPAKPAAITKNKTNRFPFVAI